MTTQHETAPCRRVGMLRWIGQMGAITPASLAARDGNSLASARARLAAAERARLVRSRRPLADQEALYVITARGARAAGLHGVKPCSLNPSNALHLITCAAVASALGRCYPDHRVLSERELLREESIAGAALASAGLPDRRRGGAARHRPDLVLWPAPPALPVAVEVELTVKAPRRLAEICRAWARCGHVAGALYLVAPEVEAPLQRALERAHARERIAVVPLGVLSTPGAATNRPAERSIPSHP